MDQSIARIVDYSRSFSFERLPDDAVHQCKRRITDALGCAMGAYRETPCRIARELAARVEDVSGARILGGTHRTLPELAAFANGTMSRYLDGNDTYPGGGGHPGDVIAPMLAVADSRRADGKAAIAAIALAYEVYRHFVRAVCLRDKGMDHVLYTAVASAVGAAKLLALDAQQASDAISMAVVPNIALHATRRGDLSAWKGVAAANAARNGVFAALMAARGMTGPALAIEGSHGLRELTGTFDITPFGGDGEPFAVTDSHLKSFLAEYHSQSPITAALELSKQVSADEIESVSIHTYWFAWHEIGSEPEKWHPTTRESADHSLPFIIAAVLIDGCFSDSIFSPERLADRAVHRMADRISVHEDEAYTRAFSKAIPCRLEIRTKRGELKVAEVQHPRGHLMNPMSDAEVSAKFDSLARRALPESQVRIALERLWKLEGAATLDGVYEALQVTGTDTRNL